MRIFLTAFLSIILLFGGVTTTYAAVTPEELETYLLEVDLTQEELEDYLMSYDLTLDDFEDVQEIRDYLGPKVSEESLAQLLADYDMTREELETLLIEYGELEEGSTIEETFLFISDIEYILILEDGLGDLEELDELFAELEAFIAEIGITEDEIMNLLTHIESISETPGFEEQLEALAYRMIEFPVFDTIDELTPEEIAELLSIYDELYSLLQVKVEYYIVEDGEKSAITLDTLMSIEDITGISILIEIYDLNGNLLLDLILTGETIDSGLVTETGDTIQQVVDKNITITENKQPTTVKGGKLPNTAGNYMGSLLVGLGLLAASIFTIRRMRAVK